MRKLIPGFRGVQCYTKSFVCQHNDLLHYLKPPLLLKKMDAPRCTCMKIHTTVQ